MGVKRNVVSGFEMKELLIGVSIMYHSSLGRFPTILEHISIWSLEIPHHTRAKWGGGCTEIITHQETPPFSSKQHRAGTSSRCEQTC